VADHNDPVLAQMRPFRTHSEVDHDHCTHDAIRSSDGWQWNGGDPERNAAIVAVLNDIEPRVSQRSAEEATRRAVEALDAERARVRELVALLRDAVADAVQEALFRASGECERRNGNVANGVLLNETPAECATAIRSLNAPMIAQEFIDAALLAAGER
jgi:hypothetical protein